MSTTLQSPLDAMGAELGSMVARIERDLRSKFEAMKMEWRAEVADHRAKMAEMETRALVAERALADSVNAKMATVRDGVSVTADDLAPLVQAEVVRAVSALPLPQNGRDGVDADPEMVASMVAQAVAALPTPVVEAPDPDEILRAVQAEVVRAVSALPVPRDGIDVDPQFVVTCVNDVVASLPPAEPGPQGPMGRLSVVRSWTDDVSYAGDIVTHEGSTYQAVRDTGRMPPHSDWAVVAAKGRDGVDGMSFRLRGTFDEAEQYQTLDVVAFNGASFVARQDAPGECPGAGWQLMSTQGKRGREGDPGRKGDPGPPGPAVVSLAIDDQGLMTLRNADGTTVTCDFYPVLSRVVR